MDNKTVNNEIKELKQQVSLEKVQDWCIAGLFLLMLIFTFVNVRIDNLTTRVRELETEMRIIK